MYLELIYEMAQAAHPFFVQNNWTWGNDETPPSAELIEDRLWSMWMQIQGRPDCMQIECGRLRISRDYPDDTHLKVSIIHTLGFKSAE